MVSFRLIFIDIDSSFETVTRESPVKGYMVVRAPKGETRPMFFDPGNSALIEAMIGVPTAHWSDIDEAIAFNNEYGLWISSPPGTGKNYPSYYGGVYFTKKGFFPFYQVSDRNNPNFLTEIRLGSEVAFDSTTTIGTNSIIIDEISDSTNDQAIKQGKFTIKGLSNYLISNLDHMVFDFWGSDFNSTKAQKFNLKLSDGKIFVKNEDGTLLGKPIGTYALVTEGEGAGTYNLVFGGNGIDGTSITKTDVGYPYFTFDKLFPGLNDLYVAGEDSLGSPIQVLNSETAAALKPILVSGGTGTLGKVTYQSVTGIFGRISWIVSVKNTSYSYICQKSPTEKVTNLKVSDIGYDKYKYDLALEYAYNFNPTNAKDIYPANADGLFVSIAENSVGKVYKKVGAKNYKDVTDDYETQYIKIITSVLGSDTLDPKVADPQNTTVCVGVNSSGKLDLLPVGFDQVNTPKPNIKFNTLNISFTEEVYPGSQTSGGEFEGSLDEEGKDAQGSGNYFLDVLPDDAMSFVEFVPIKTFDEDLDKNGIFTGTRVVDLKGPEPDTFSVAIQGQRYISKLVQDNIDKGMVGNVWNDDMETVLKAGWQEAFFPTYDEAHVFMEVTGCENFKSTLASLRATQKLSTIVSQKKISNAEFTNPKKIVVAGRSTGTAQYVGEFEKKCPYTKKKYWMCPIGDVGLQCARIIDKKLGGWAPSGTNITGNIGGQLGRAVLRAKWDFSDKQLVVFEEKGLNAITYTTAYGLMIQGQYTTQDPSIMSDWLFLVHTMSFDLCKREIRENVMVPQLWKPINKYWMDIRQRGVDDILEKRTTGEQAIWTEAKCKIESENTASTKAKRNFMIRTIVKVTPVSERVSLTFENVGQSVVIS